MQCSSAAIIGTGRMGLRHIKAARLLDLDIVGICDIKPEALAGAGREHEVEESRWFSDPISMLAETRPEFVIVSTTADHHCELTCMAASAGARYILCEKPMACSVSQCDRMIQTCERHGALLAINHVRRYMPSFIEAGRIVRSEEFGGLRSMTVVAGNIGVAMNGSHFFDAFRNLTGETPFEVIAWFIDSDIPNPRGPQFKDAAGSVRMTTQSGQRFYLDCGPRQGHRCTITYAGPFGQLVVDDLSGRMFCTVRETEQRSLPSTRYGLPSVDKTIDVASPDIIELCTSCVRALLSGHGYPSGEDGRMAVRMLTAAYVSNARQGTPVQIIDRDVSSHGVFPWP